jgi:hypothetical protein
VRAQTARENHGMEGELSQALASQSLKKDLREAVKRFDRCYVDTVTLAASSDLLGSVLPE